MSPCVAAVSARRGHHFSKTPALAITLIAGEGVLGDGHRGRTVKHRSRVMRDPAAPNLRQVHLIARERLHALAEKGFALGAGELGENILTEGLDLDALSRGTRLMLGAEAVVEVTGLRNPCKQIEDFRAGLLAEMIGRSPEGAIIRKAGIMGIVLTGGTVFAGDAIAVQPPSRHVPLAPV